MDYNKIILDNTKEDELFHKAVQDLKREYAVLAKAIAQGEQGSAAIVVGAMETSKYTLTNRNASHSLSVQISLLLLQGEEQERRTALLLLSFSAICNECRAVQAVS